MHVIAAKAVAFKEALQPEFKTYIEQVVKNAKAMGDTLMERGYNLVSGGTDTHLILLDLRDKEYTGKDAEEALGKTDITVNKNTIPFDTQSPFVTSGIRVGTPAITTRGFGLAEMTLLAGWILLVLLFYGCSAAASTTLPSCTASSIYLLATRKNSLYCLYLRLSIIAQRFVGVRKQLMVAHSSRSAIAMPT